MLPINTYTKITARKNTNIALYGSAKLGNVSVPIYQLKPLLRKIYMYKICINNNDTVF